MKPIMPDKPEPGGTPEPPSAHQSKAATPPRTKPLASPGFSDTEGEPDIDLVGDDGEAPEF